MRLHDVEFCCDIQINEFHPTHIAFKFQMNITNLPAEASLFSIQREKP